MRELYYDPYDYAIDADPHPVWRRMRDESPLYRNERHDFFALSRFRDVLDASLDHARYSSARGTVLEMIRADQPPVRPLIFMDPPEHDTLRALVSRAFTPRRISALEPRIRELARQLLDERVGSGGFDYVADFGALLPMMVISEMLGIPEKDRDLLRERTDRMLHREPGQTLPPADLTAEIFGYVAGYVQERRSQPRDDMMTDLLQAEVPAADGRARKLDDMELLSFVMLLFGAGNETVARLLGNAGAVLARFPEERARLVAEPGRIPNAVEELLRYEAPSPVQARYTTADAEWYGETVPAGSVLLLLTGSAGRDERQYPDPDRFDVGREVGRHVSFGYGAHFCLGASLARLESRVALEETLARFPSWEVDAERCERVHTSTVRGFARLPILL